MNCRKAIAVFAALSLLAAGCSSKPAEPETEPEETEETQPEPTPEPSAYEKAQAKAAELLGTMSTEEKAAQLIHMAVRTWNGENLTEMNEEVADLFKKYEFGGICLFAENITTDNAKTIRLTQALQAAATTDGRIPLMISADQEGGYIYRLQNGTVTPGNMALAATGDTANAKAAADIIGSELQALGFNTDFAPDADVNANPKNPVIGVRSFSDDPETVASFTQAYTEGLSQNGVIAAIKHFPGHGDTAVDSHTGLPLINKTKAELEASDLIPFAAMAKQGYHDMIMSAHIQFPQIETGVYTSILDGQEIHLPATLSKTFLTDIVRGELGYEGVIITDSLIMDAIKDHFDTKDSAALALNAGVDMLLMPVDMTGTESLEAIDAYMADLVSLIEEGTVAMSRVDEAVTRILTLKYERGIMDQEYSEAATEKLIASAGLVGSEAHIEKEIEIASAAATVLENNGVLPLAAEGNTHFVLCGMNPAQTNALGYSFNRLQAQSVIPEETEAVVINADWSNNYGEVYGYFDWTDVLIMTDFMWTADLIDPSYSDQIPAAQALIKDAQAQGIQVIVISAGLPYDLSLLRDADALMAVFCQVGAPNVDDAFNPTGAFGPGIPGAMNVIFGKTKPSGKLPVNIPAVSDGAFAGENAYTRGTGLTW